MRIFSDVGLVVLAFVAVLVASTQCSGAERYKITNDKRQVVGDVYCPGHGRRCQVRDNDRRIKFYIERDGTVTDSRRRKVKEIELEK